MKLLIGLGNPGEKFQHNRHNVGQMFIDWVINHSLSDRDSANLRFLENNRRHEADGWRLVKSTVFMNQSGAEVKKLLKIHKLTPADLIIVHDDLDIQLGQFKIQLGGGPKLHNGVNSIEKSLKTAEFWRLRIGVDNRDSQHRTEGEKYVLQNFLLQEETLLPEIFKKAVDKLRIIFHNELIK